MATLSKDGTRILNNYDRYTGEPFNATKVVFKDDGSPYTDNDVDNVIIFKNLVSLGGGYSKRAMSGTVKAIWFGVKADGITDNTQAFLRIIRSCTEQNITAIELPSGQINVNTDSINGNSFVFPNPIRFYGQGMGGRHYRDIVATKVTAIVDKSVTSTAPLFKFDGTSTALYNPLPCTELYNMAFVGNGQNRVAVMMFRTGWETVWDRVSFDYFKGGAIFFDSAFDTNMDNITITRCGGLNAGVASYAITETSTIGDISNAHHFNNLHIEFCRYYINFDICRNIYINNFKFEQFGAVNSLPYMNGVTTDLVNPMLRFGAGAWEVALQNGMIITRQLDEWLLVNPSNTVADMPYNIKSYATALDSRRIHKFINVDFTSPDNGVNPTTGTSVPCIMGSRIVDTGDFGKFVFADCSLNNVTGYVNGIRLKNSKMTDCKSIYIRRGTQNISGITLEVSELTNNNIFAINTVSSPDGTAIEFVDAVSRATDNVINTYVNKYKFTVSGANQCAYTRTSAAIILTDLVYMGLMGLSSIDYSNVVIDLSKIDTSFIRLQFSQDATIKTVLNAFRGEQVTFLCDVSGRTFTFATGGVASNSIYADSIGSITGGQSKQFMYSSFVFFSPNNQVATPSDVTFTII